MFGKIFGSLFTGSMYGAGAPVFSVMSYVIANMKPDSFKPHLVTRFTVELNVKDLANRIGEPEDTIQGAIEFLCSPDPNSRSEAEQGRRLLRVGAFEYLVVNGVRYHQIRNAEERRENNAERQRRFRAKKKGGRVETMAERVRRQVEEDPTTIADRKVMHEKYKNGDFKKEPTTFEKEYDLDYPGGQQAPAEVWEEPEQ